MEALRGPCLGLGDECNSADQTETECECAAARVDHRVTHRIRTSACCGNDATVGTDLCNCVPQGSCLQHRSQMQRLVANEVNGACALHDGDGRLVHGLPPPHHHQRLHHPVQPFPPVHRRGDEPFGM